MINFNALVGSKKEITAFDLLKIYSTLDVKSSHTEPRPAQKEAFQELSARSAERDLVLKVNTGSGKTTIGLLFAYAHMRLSKQPVAYLCPTTQLVEQVLSEAARLGVAAEHYAGGQPQPPFACIRADAVLVCTYEKLFNAKTTFNRQDVNLIPYALVLDDAHAGVEIVRKCFTLPLGPGAFSALKQVLRPQCSKYHPTLWASIENADPLAVFEVPHWIWSDVAQDVHAALQPFAGEGQFPFVWPYLSESLRLCRCVVSGSGAEITPEVPPTQDVRPYAGAAHRLFMSATLADDSALVRELGADGEAARTPISPTSDRGLGERMVIAPSLVDPALDRHFVMGLCADLAKTVHVVVMASSELQANEWTKYGAKVFLNEKFAEGVSCLRDPSSGLNFAVFVQRYDGVDLPDDACRVLVIDGKPHGEGLVDRFDSSLTTNPGGIRNKAVYRVEQGMGRAVRTHADYAVVLLVGSDLTTFVGRNDVLSAMTQDTRNQLNLGFELVRLLKQAGTADPAAQVRALISSCLNRDAGWKGYYAEKVRDLEKQSATVNAHHIALAQAERRAYELAELNQVVEGFGELNKALGGNWLSDEERSLYLQRLSRLAYQFDKAQAMSIQVAARKKSKVVALPPEVVVTSPDPQAMLYAQSVCVWLKEFHQLNAAILELQSIRKKLDFSNKPRTVESAVQQLGAALGAASTRPDDEFHSGPDNLWLWGETALVIEVKSQKKDSLNKGDSGQLHNSCEWTAKQHPAWAGKILPVVICDAPKVDKDANFPQGTLRITSQKLFGLADALLGMCQALAAQGPIFVTPDNVAAELAKRALTPAQFKKSWCTGLA